MRGLIEASPRKSAQKEYFPPSEEEEAVRGPPVQIALSGALSGRLRLRGPQGSQGRSGPTGPAPGSALCAESGLLVSGDLRNFHGVSLVSPQPPLPGCWALLVLWEWRGAEVGLPREAAGRGDALPASLRTSRNRPAASLSPPPPQPGFPAPRSPPLLLPPHQSDSLG